MGKYIEWNFSHNQDEDCSNCGMKETESKGCCENEQNIFKIDDDQKSTSVDYQIPHFAAYSFNALLFETAYINAPSLITERTHSNALLREHKIPLFILHRAFRT